MEFVPDWSGLPPELLEQIAKRLPLFEDLTAFRGVCTTWRSAVITWKNEYQFKVPLLMLSQKHHSYKRKFYSSFSYSIKMEHHSRRKYKIGRLCRRKKERQIHEREFYSLSKRKICARLPSPDVKSKKCTDVGFGWILTVSASGRKGMVCLGDISDGKVSLVKPFCSSPKINLPNLKKLPLYEMESPIYPDFDMVTPAVLLDDPSETSDFRLILLGNNFLVLWKNGDKNWTRISVSANDLGTLFINMIYYKGCIYAIGAGARLYVWDPCGIDPTKARLILEMDDYTSQLLDNSMPYSVESTDGELLVILRNNHTDPEDYEDIGAEFRVMKVDPETRTIEEIKSVGQDAIFVGNNATVAVAASDYPGVLRPNCIYFTDDCSEAYFLSRECRKGGGKDMGIYSLEDGSTERFEVESFSPISPPMWIFPSF